MAAPLDVPPRLKAQIFDGFSIACAFLGGILLDPPGEEFLRDLKDKDLIREWPVRPNNPDSELGISLLQKALEGNLDLLAKRLAEDFTRLFFGPDKAPVPPYESVYVGKEKILFDTSTLEVRDLYRRMGFRIRALNQVPDDHIGLEMAFLSRLCSLSGTARRYDQNRLESLAAFLNTHTLRWVDRFTDLAAKYARSDFYRGTAFLLKGTLKALAEFIDV